MLVFFHISVGSFECITFIYDYFKEFSAAEIISLIEAHNLLILVNMLIVCCRATPRRMRIEAFVQSMEVILNNYF